MINCVLYIVDAGFTAEGPILGKMDPVTLSVSRVGPILNEKWSILGLASNGSEIYAWGTTPSLNTPSLLSINKDNGKGTVIGSIGVGPINALLSNKAGVIYTVAGEPFALELLVIDSATGKNEKIGNLDSSIQSVGGLVFDIIGNIFTLINVTNNSAPNNNGTYLAPINLSTGEINIGAGMKFNDNAGANNINSLAYCGFHLFGSGTNNNIYYIKAPVGETLLVGQPNYSNGSVILLSGMTACTG